jgi:hypothetical protein
MNSDGDDRLSELGNRPRPDKLFMNLSLSIPSLQTFIPHAGDKYILPSQPRGARATRTMRGFQNLIALPSTALADAATSVESHPTTSLHSNLASRKIQTPSDASAILTTQNTLSKGVEPDPAVKEHSPSEPKNALTAPPTVSL